MSSGTYNTSDPDATFNTSLQFTTGWIGRTDIGANKGFIHRGREYNIYIRAKADSGATKFTSGIWNNDKAVSEADFTDIASKVTTTYQTFLLGSFEADWDQDDSVYIWFSNNLGVGSKYIDYLMIVPTEISGGTVVDENGNVGIGTTTPTHLLNVDGTMNVSGNTFIDGDLKINGQDIFSSGDLTLDPDGKTVHIAQNDVDFDVEDGSVCIGDDGCTPSTGDGNLLVEGEINVGHTSTQAYNFFGASPDPGSGQITDANDVFIQDDLEVDGTAYLAGGTAWTQGDIAERLETKKSREGKICSGDIECLKESTEDNLEYGDLVCIDVTGSKLIMKCTEANSQLAVGFISNTAVLHIEPTLVNGYPVALAGIVSAKVTNVNGNIYPGDLLVSAERDGYAMKNNDPELGTVVGKAFDFCYEEECNIPVFVALS
jgi:hypothetical protein